MTQTLDELTLADRQGGYGWGWEEEGSHGCNGHELLEKYSSRMTAQDSGRADFRSLQICLDCSGGRRGCECLLELHGQHPPSQGRSQSDAQGAAHSLQEHE